MLALKGLIGLHRTIQLQLLQVTGWGIDLDNCDIAWFALETNRDHPVIFEIASKYCILDSFVDHDGYSLSFFLFQPQRVFTNTLMTAKLVVISSQTEMVVL